MTKLIVCCDGTWNAPDQRAGGLPAPTNVVKLANALAERDAFGGEQRKYYHPGVGVGSGLIGRWLGGAIGVGLDKNIKSAYKWLAQNYRPGDQIYIFGFSRGAYTARFVAGLISDYGLVDLSDDRSDDGQKWAIIDRIYRLRGEKGAAADKAPTLSDLAFFNAERGAPGAGKTPIWFLGVWDTVGALGIPSDMALLKLFDWIWPHQFAGTGLSRVVRHARHAVALDENRQSFTPTFWTETAPDQDVAQIWFAGAHGDVGGGHVETGLSDIALGWMIEQASEQGLAFRDEAIAQLAPSPRGVLHESAAGLFAFLRTLPRNAPPIVAGSPALHQSVLVRHANPPLAQAPFWPTRILQPGEKLGVEAFARPHWNATGLYLEQGVAYRFEAAGQWMDGSIPCGPAGSTPGQNLLARLAYAIGECAGWAERFYRRATGNQRADFMFSKREEDYPWFALVGVVANGYGVDETTGDPDRHQSFLIGRGVASFRPEKSGYLYCFANDAWQMYFNNRGGVRLVVTRL